LRRQELQPSLFNPAAGARSLFSSSARLFDPPRRFRVDGLGLNSSDATEANMETIPAHFPRGEVRALPQSKPPQIDQRWFFAHLRVSAQQTADLTPLTPQDGFVEWDKVDIDSLEMPRGDDMGIPRYV
jgi:hypothetical protein